MVRMIIAFRIESVRGAEMQRISKMIRFYLSRPLKDVQQQDKEAVAAEAVRLELETTFFNSMPMILQAL
eukprot:scaffold1004_cov105-Cylindrotheca_fusiformis.AAC.9